MITNWSVASGPGVVTFANTSAVDTTASFSIAGTYVLELVADDSNFTSFDTVTITVIPPNQPPTVDAGSDQTISWSDSATLDGTVSDDGLPNPPGVVNTNWSVASGPGAVTFANTSTLNPTVIFSVAGVYVLRLTADDSYFTGSDTVTITVIPPNQPPTVEVTAPMNDDTVSGVVTVSADATDDVGVVGVQFKLDGVDLGVPDTTPPYTLNWDTTASADGPYQLTAIATDAAGNATTSTVVNVTVANNVSDTTPPTISISEPTNEAEIAGMVTISADASDNVGVAGVQFQVNGTNLGVPDTTPPYTLNWDTTAASADGPYQLTAIATDAAGNATTSAVVNVTVNSVSDTTPPTISISEPAAGASVAGTVTISADASDNVGLVGVQFKVHGVDLGVVDTVAPYSIQWDTLASPNNVYLLTAVASDAAGNSTTSAAIMVMVNNTSPPVASDDSATTPEDTPVTVDAAANDTDVDGNLDPTSATVTNGPSNGTLLNNGNGTFAYTPNENFNGSDDFIYQICDTDNQCDTAMATITVNPINDNPTTNNDDYSTSEATTLNIATPGLLGNDFDVDGDTIFVDSFAATSQFGGSVFINSDGPGSYTPATGFEGIDTFSYTISDGNGGFNTATVNITVVSTEAQIEDQINQVNALVEGGDLNQGHGQALINKLDDAFKKLEKGNTTAACDTLAKYIERVERFIVKGQIDPDIGQALIDAATTARAVCSP